MEKIRLGLVGGGIDSLIGVLHSVASNMFYRYQIKAGCFSIRNSSNQESGKLLGVDSSRIYQDIDTMIEREKNLPKNERVEVVSVLTPNFLHYSMSKKLIENGFHVICEKPMTTTYQEAKNLKSVVDKHKAIFGLTHTYTGYPMVRQMRQMIEKGALGNIQKVDVQYYQGWINPIIHDKEKRSSTWRLDPSKAGQSCCIGDIGIHAFNLIEYVTQNKVKEVLSDFNTLYQDNPMDIDATVLLRIGDRAKGVLRSSQIATCEENNFNIAIYGNKGLLKWEQENPNILYHMIEGSPMQIIKPGYDFNTSMAQDGIKLPAGHPEGIFDSMANIYKGIAKAIRGEDFDKGEFPTITDGLRGMDFIEKTIASNKEGNIWKTLN